MHRISWWWHNTNTPFIMNLLAKSACSSGSATYQIAVNGTVDTASTAPVQISSLLDNPVQTAKITYAANLPASATTAYTSTSSTVNVYDALGNTHQTSVVWANTGTNTWQATVTVAAGGGTTDNYKSVFDVTFNSGTNIGTISTITGVSAGYYRVLLLRQ